MHVRLASRVGMPSRLGLLRGRVATSRRSILKSPIKAVFTMDTQSAYELVWEAVKTRTAQRILRYLG